MKTEFAQELYVYARAMQIVGTSVAETLEQLNQSGNPREINSLHELIGSHQFNATGQMMILIAIMLDATQYVDNREYTDAEVKVLPKILGLKPRPVLPSYPERLTAARGRERL